VQSILRSPVSLPVVWIPLVGTVLFSLIALKYLTLAWLMILVTSAAAFLSMYYFFRRSRCGFILFNLGVVATMLSILECYSYSNIQTTRFEKEYERKFMRDDSVLGYAPVHGQLAPVKRFAGSQLIYDVTYTIDADGLRIAAGLDENPHDNRCMLFFGCSFTFGEGVDDHEAMPYVAGTLANLRA
jgi:hypothetical protein